MHWFNIVGFDDRSDNQEIDDRVKRCLCDQGTIKDVQSKVKYQNKLSLLDVNDK